MVSKANRWKPQMTRAEAYRALGERLRAYAQKPEAADYVAEFKQLAKCYRLLAESAERKAQFNAPQSGPPLSKRRLHYSLLADPGDKQKAKRPPVGAIVRTLVRPVFTRLFQGAIAGYAVR